MIVKEDIVKAFKDIGILPTDVILVHSSLKSIGFVDGGAETVIEALKEVVCDGTLCMPALRQKNFIDAYKDWDILNTPSDVGLITETFRKSAGVLRSNQPTHSVCAYGKDAKYITEAHSTGKPRYCYFGKYAFGYNSPWERMIELGAKVVFIGVNMTYNTFKHYCEYKNATDIIDLLSGDAKQQAINELKVLHDENNKGTVFFGHDGFEVQKYLESLGKIHYGKCGDATLTMYNVKEYMDVMLKEIFETPSKWLYCGAEWCEKYIKLIK